MPFPYLLTVDPQTLKLPTTRLAGADPGKLWRQIARFGKSIAGMPAPLVVIDSDGVLQLIDGVTRATRVAKLLPGTMIQVEVIGPTIGSVQSLPTIGDKLP